MRYTFSLFFILLAALPVPAQDTPRDLFAAIRRNDVEAIESLLAKGADSNGRNPQGATPLMYAALHAGLPAMRLLLDRGADPNAKNNAGATALIWGAGDPAKVRLLIERGAGVNAPANSGRTPLTVAASFPGNLEAVQLLLSKGADPKAVSRDSGGPVVSAALAADPEVLRLLLKSGADPDEQGNIGSKRGATPLMVSAFSGCRECVRLLLDSGAAVNARSAPTRMVKAGLQEIGELTPLLCAATRPDKAIIQDLLDSRAEVNAKDARGMTPLALAVSSETQDAGIIRLLLDKGAGVNTEAADGQTVVTWARKWGDTPIVKMLADAGAKPSDSPSKASTRGNSPPAGAPQAVVRSLALLQASAPVYFNKSGCVGCHHQMLTLMVAGAARERGIRFDEKLNGEILNVALTVNRPQREALLQRVHLGGAPMSLSLFLTSLGAQNYPADDMTDAMVHDLAGQQFPDGSWHGLDNRPPIEYSAFSETAYAVRALSVYSPPGRRDEMNRRIARAARWLRSAQPQHTEERVMQLLGLLWSGSKPGSVRDLMKPLLSSQEPGGGWSQRKGLPGDAYATGQVLYALRQAGVPPRDPAFRRGAGFLLNSQHEDGSWYVRSRAVKFQPYFESGFPHGHDQWISAAGTAWAALALSQAVESRSSGSRK